MISKSLVQAGLYSPMTKGLVGALSAYFAYPIAEYIEKRDVRSKRRKLKQHYKQSFAVRKKIAQTQLVEMLHFVQANVPYYKDLFKAHQFDPDIVSRDIAYLNELPYLTKDIIREQGDRLLSRSLKDYRHHACKTGGSTGLSAVINYDQAAADYSAAVTLFCRDFIGKPKRKDELHFACRFPDTPKETGWTREDWKCLAMNRSNIFFDRLDGVGLEEIWQTLLHRKPYLVHGHPSTLYALACYIERQYGKGKAFAVFEPSGELLQPYMRETIARVFQCKVVNRYGLAEFGVMAYQLKPDSDALQFLDSEGWPETTLVNGEQELVITGFRNRLMPLIRYRTGDLADLQEQSEGFFLTDIVGRVHDMVKVNGIDHPTHHIQDILDHRVGGIQEFQIDIRSSKPILKVVPEPNVSQNEIKHKIQLHWQQAFDLQFVEHDDFVRVGRHAKFRHVVQ